MKERLEELTSNVASVKNKNIDNSANYYVNNIKLLKH
jgi:hypothetical protein